MIIDEVGSALNGLIICVSMVPAYEVYLLAASLQAGANQMSILGTL
eukprot:CAMPEP_0194038404 /NCGR_PEP_ID=MMETSP0009_2-20130614/10644_1 /TAXON_ID=210454 /ORGANISM="Grammatophora oceanica, Strain CCMP 410" /LENGTH=45 /DNA_ID= /DNA_START= /DNA_END= /DNA_ORIENTATION=